MYNTGVERESLREREGGREGFTDGSELAKVDLVPEVDVVWLRVLGEDPAINLVPGAPSVALLLVVRHFGTAVGDRHCQHSAWENIGPICVCVCVE